MSFEAGISDSIPTTPMATPANRELKWQKQWQQKCHLKIEVALKQTYITLILFQSICQVLENFSGVDSKGLQHPSSEKGKAKSCLCSCPP